MRPGSYFNSACLFLLMAALPSCKKFVEVPSPTNQLDINSVFTDDKTATAAVIGMYSDMEFSSPISAYLTILPGLSSDELSSTSSDQGFLDFFTNTYMPNNQYSAAVWGIYSNVYEANSCMQGIQNSRGLSPGTKNQLLGEALFSRAFCYFYLVNLFGDVPLVTSTDYRIADTMRRTPSSRVYQQMISDLLYAQTLLRSSYPTEQRVRPNLWTATSLLSRAYLFTAKWAEAESQASSVINSGVYTMTAIDEGVFGNGSNETIWQLMPVNPYSNTQEAALFIPGSPTQIPIYPLTNDFVNAFEPGDKRITHWTGNMDIGGELYYYPYKYRIPGGSPASEYHIVFRLAEQYLIRAEARIQQGKITGAIQDLNIIRDRAGLPPLSTSMTADLATAALQQERRIELFAEFGHRWLDLRRTNKIDLVLGALKPSTWRSTAALWPIPQAQRSANPFLTQNKGY
ncbi:RagB/SusD family nutrient uptake outer membrane protein [Flavitalea sp. BT771]|uniref:RagB/SusD family nutrient uptake outer membrane protein n=1 Tax=Flavitalea sp. BT771 TaxID=3063329 RepID=UPI0026E2B3D8|nr:RagB/SusD family nutrient uptake outer membrane protein [Flavitalea sp. BT771]MDO6430839.1 RagB/SusD family nutrient uptake outer membrane protein [Flavitalea sp. BT771]MDV6219021.1 RagB/SusD family nutrient uptake outer membrane protein [Flavitalea sp. BT771]